MSNKSDHNKPQFDINEYLPEVYKSDVNRSVFDVAFNRHLTKDDTTRVAGYVGTGNPAALINRQIKEPTPHRQAYQLAPTMYTKTGTLESALSQKAFLEQLNLMGVDIERLPYWANALKFNWIPPVNIDMLVNYQDYFWVPDNPQDPPQYITIENRCRKARSKVNAYENVLAQRGALFNIVRADFLSNAFIISSKQDDVFATGFTFYTKNTTNANLLNKQWTVTLSTYSPDTDETTIIVEEVVAILSATPPIATFVGQWWLNTTNNVLSAWSGSAWLPTVTSFIADISLEELLTEYQIESNCACNEDFGWDTAQWDDNQNPELTEIWKDSPAWNESPASFIQSISSPTAPISPVPQDLWWNTTIDVLYQRNLDNTAWQQVVLSFSTIVNNTLGASAWDLTKGCEPQVLNQWSEQNRWMHKSEINSFVGIKRAQLPILEFNSSLELNNWVKDTHTWSYRSEIGQTFEQSNEAPTRLELEPIKGYVASNQSGIWTIYLFDTNKTIERDIDYTSIFIPGFLFRFTDDSTLSETYTVSSSEYREMIATDPVPVGYFVTVIKLVETNFTAPLVADPLLNTRIEPLQTTKGDTWRGYHAHWLYGTVTSTVPVTPQSPAILRQRDITTSITPSATPQGTLYVGNMYQELTLQIPNVFQVDLDAKLTLTVPPVMPSVSSRYYGVPGGSALRVYVNGIRQYGNYEELVASSIPNYTVVGYTTYTNFSYQYITGIKFDKPLAQFDVVRIEVGPAAQSDIGLLSVPVRTIADEVAFAQAIIDGTQPTYTSLIEYRQIEQVKTQLNQYPLFNVYDVITDEVVKAAPLFAFAESSTSPINTSIQRRIISTQDGRDYQFEQTLLDYDNNQLYGYRNTTALITTTIGDTPSQWWYNPVTKKLVGWDGFQWTSTVQVVLSTGSTALRTPIIQNSEPTADILENSLWYTPSGNALYQYISTNWTLIATPTIESDPALQTVWKHGLNDEQFIPQYVDKDRNPITVGSSDGDWQLLDQWIYNPEHHNRSTLQLSELVTHITSILAAQNQIPGLLNGSLFTMTQDEFNYGLGGTIRDYNDSFDTLISAVNVTNITPIGTIEFAQEQYAANLQSIKDLYIKNIVQLMMQYNASSIVNQGQYIANAVIDEYEQNEFFVQVYGDSSAYNTQDKIGIKGWIATAPMFALSQKFQPHVNSSNTIVEIFHHDGHRSRVTLSTSEQDRLIRILISQSDSRVTNGKYGVISSINPPTTVATYVSAFSGLSIRPGTYWYKVGSGVRQLFRLNSYGSFDSDPPVVVMGTPLPEGTMYYNTLDKAVYQIQSNIWTLITNVGDEDISPLWVLVDMHQLLADVFLEVEQRLYDVTPTYETLAFDFDSLTPNVNEQNTYDEYYYQQFMAYVADLNITAPLINTAYASNNPFTWNYVSSVITTPPRSNLTPDPHSSWQQLYTDWYGTPYPHLEPWKLQGFSDKPFWWDAEYLNVLGVRRWKYVHATATGMWENIRAGVIPSGRTYASGKISTGNTSADGEQLPTYNYFSVNIGDISIGGYVSDELLPPYFDNSVHGTVIPDPTIRSMFVTFATEIVAPDADFVFGDMGPVEWAWTTSLQYVYDKSIIAFKMQPVRFMHYTFGPQFLLVDSLQVETQFKQVYSHEDTLFHGDLYDTNKQYNSRGLNQWYVNFNRFSGFDTNTQFRSEWVDWSPTMTYQFAGIIDTSSFDIATKYFDINAQDYSIILANSGVIQDTWVDAFEVSILSTPPAFIQYNTESLWKLELDTLGNNAREVTYYGVKSYPFVCDNINNTINVMQFSIAAIVPASKKIYIKGDQSYRFTQGKTLTISNSNTNNGTYTIIDSTYEVGSNRTRINVTQPLVSSATDGILDLNDTIVDWVTGSQVVFSSTKLLPSPLVINTPYYLVKIADNVYKVAETLNDAEANITIDIITNVHDQLTISELSTSFLVFGGSGNSSDTWYHYALDMNDVRTFIPPMTVYGMQSLVNIIDGYVQVQREQGILFGVAEAGEFDPDTGRSLDWQLEIERFINWSYGIRRSKLVVADRYQVDTSIGSEDFTFTGAFPSWTSGTAITFSTTGSLPAPLTSNTLYYFFPTIDSAVFKVATTSIVYDPSMYITISSTGSGSLQISLYDRNNAFPSMEINPSRNSIWLDTPTGVLANVIEGAYADIRVQQTIFDQYGRPLLSNNLTTYRWDKTSKVTMRPEVQNDVEPFYVNDPYHYLHFGGAHLFLEGYEHYLLLNSYTVGGDLVYDAFLGLYTKKFDLDYYEKLDYSLRPTLGGFYLLDQHFARNIEGSADDMRHYYDAYDMAKTPDVAQRAQALVGYKGDMDFLDLLNVNSKSQFLFYRGMLQAKGSIASIKAYINSRRFVDAKMDEFWAWKIAEFGDIRPRVYPEIKLFSTDGVLDDVRLEFLASSELDTDPEIIADAAQGFQLVSFRDNTRWVNFPQQKTEIVTPLFLDSEVSSMSVVFVGTYEPTAEQVIQANLQYWFNTASNQYNQWTWVDQANKLGSWVSVMGQAVANNDGIYIKHQSFCDTVRVLRRTLDEVPASNSNFGIYTTNILTEGSGVDEFTRVNSETIRFNPAGFTDILVIFTINPSRAKINPAKLIDTKAEVVLQNVQLWHPAHGDHYYMAIHNVDVQRESDPANYQFTLNPTNNSEQPWSDRYVGTVWLDSSQLGYLPYYDDGIYPDINDRLYNWGKLAPWASVKVYQWIKTTVAPEAWDAQVLADANNSTISQNDKATGTPRRTLFKRTRDSVLALNVGSIEDGTPSGSTYIEIPTPSLQDGNYVVFTTTGTLPSGILSGTKYLVTNVTGISPQQFQIADAVTEINVDILDDGLGSLTVVPAFTPGSWIPQPLIREKHNVVFDIPGPYPVVLSSFVLDSTQWSKDDTAQIYVNGVLLATDLVVDDTLTINFDSITINEQDIFDIVRPIHVITEEESNFDPDSDDDGTQMVQWKEDYEYTITSTTEGGVNTGAVTTTNYFFWVENSTARNTQVRGDLSIYEVARQLETIPIPYFVVQKPKDDPVLVEKYGYGVAQYESAFSLGDIAEQFFVVPVLYRQAILRKIASYIADDDRYVIRFTRDLTLRDKLGSRSNLKDKHEEWFLFRKSQPSSIPQELWNKLTEAMMGYSLNDTSVRVPSLERELYDASYGTETRFGLGADQAFVDKTLAIATVIYYLQDPTKDFYPADIDDFFQRNNFNTPEAIKTAMLEIYTTFPSEHVNAIWFETLQDALSTKSKYKELMKTSWIALHGIRVLEVNGLFDE